MVYQPLETRIERLNNHVEVVSAHYRRALANIEFYPDPRKLELRDQITSEYQNFNKAAALVREGRIVKDIQERVCGEARSWVKGNIPAGIARYSFYQISEQELTQRSAVCRQLVRACKGRLSTALDTIEKLSKHDGDPRKSTIQKVREEFATLERALNLYERGFSFVEIKALTGESIQTRVEDKTIPETILRFGGYPLSEHESESRKAEIRNLEAAAVKAHQEATERQKERDATSLPERRKAWQVELRNMKLVFDLYTTGLSLSGIQDLTGLNAGQWIRDGALPVKLAYARRDLVDRNFVVPTRVDANLAYIVGALCGSTRVFSRNQGISFRDADPTRVMDVRDRFQRVFSTSLADAIPEGRGYAVRVGRSALVRALFDRLGIVDGSTDFVPPFEVIKYSDTCRAFVQGFLTFSKGTLDVDRHIFQVVRSSQSHIVKVVAVGLYLEKIYPVVRQNHHSVSLTISAQREFDTLCKFAPMLLSEEDKEKVARRPLSQEDPLSSYTAYQKISEVLRGAYPGGVKLNVEDILRRAGIKCEVTNDVRAKVSYWRSGRKPYVAQRAEALEQMLGTLYPESKA